MGELPAHQPNSFTILDMEASIEHLTRGTVRNVDLLLVVTEPYYRSLETTARIVPLAGELGLDRVAIVANKVRTARDEAVLRDYCRSRNYPVVDVVPFDECVTAADQAGRALIDWAPESPAVGAIARIAAWLCAQPGTPRAVDRCA